jgi:hypothetical protein
LLLLQHLKKDLLLERQVRQRLRLYDAEPEVVEDLEVEEEEEEETFPGKELLPWLLLYLRSCYHGYSCT